LKSGGRNAVNFYFRLDGIPFGGVARDSLNSVRVGPGKEWSRGRELNSRPADYESAALPLSYLGP
jgi:hypothetical protein